MDVEQSKLVGVIRGLMLADNLGDVHEQINHLCDLVHIPRPEGDFLDGWTEDDCRNVGMEYDPDQDDDDGR